MRITKINGIFLIGILLLLGACGSPATITPPATPGTGAAAFITSELTITPKTVKPGEPVEVGVMVTNTGGEQGTYTVVMKLHDGTIVKTQDVTLGGAARQKVTLNMSMNSVGTYMIMIDKLAGNLVVQDAVAPALTQPAPVQTQPTPTQPTPTQPAPTPVAGPAIFVLSDLKIEPEMPEPKDDVIVIVKVTNTGGQRGTYTAVLKINGETIKTQDVTLEAGASQGVRINFAAGPIGKYKVTVGNLTGELVVMDM